MHHTTAPSTSDPRSPMAKRNQTPSAETTSYFSTPAGSFSSIPITPLGGAPSSTSAPGTRASTTPKAGQDPTTGDQEMLNRFASCFPPPPALTLTTGRQSSSSHHRPDPRPQITTAHRAQARPPVAQQPVMDVLSSPQKHTFHVHLPTTIQPEMISISANRGDRLRVTAGAWHVENDCHYEWHINFPPRDVDMGSIHARFEEHGHLYIDARRFGAARH